MESFTEKELEAILRKSLGKPKIAVTNIQQLTGLGGLNSQNGSELKQMVASVEENGQMQTFHFIVKTALRTGESYLSVLLGLFFFCHEAFWFETALPELIKMVSPEQGAALKEIMPRVHYTSCNFNPGCLPAFHKLPQLLLVCVAAAVAVGSMASKWTQLILSTSITLCCFYMFMAKYMEEGVIVMENLKEQRQAYIDLKDIERTSGGGVKTEHMRLILASLAHVHGAWMVWLRSGQGMGRFTRREVMELYSTLRILGWRWIWKWVIQHVTQVYIDFIDTTTEDPVLKYKLETFRDSPKSINKLIKFNDHKGSKFQTMCHSDLWTSQVMMSVDSGGES